MEVRTVLVISRKLGEKVFIGDNIVLTVVDIDRNKIRLGFTAPREIEIDREEIRKAKLSDQSIVDRAFDLDLQEGE
jgi:carbon storage regulator